MPPSEVSLETLLRHPRFEEAARLYVRLNLEACLGNPTIRQILGNSARHVAFSLISTLSASEGKDGGAPLLLQSRVIDMIQAMSLSGHGKIERLINRMADQGMIVREPLDTDRRAKSLRPTEAFLELDDILCAIHARPCALLIDDPLVAGVARGDRTVTRQMRASAMPLIEGGGAMLMRNPQMLHFLMADAGWVILYALVDAIWRDDKPAQRVDAIAQACGVSRPHVRNLLMKARDFGLLEDAGPGLFVPSASFMEVVLNWIGECLAAFLGCCQLAAKTPALRVSN